jgi:Surfeit locus protein 6
MPMGDNVPAETVEEMQERSETIKQKFEQRKLTKKSSNKSDRRKLRQEKLLKKQQTLNRKKTMTNELLKQERAGKKVKVKEDPDTEQAQQESKKSAVYNKEGKLFFSKIHIDGEKKKKSHETNPQLNLQKLKAQKKKIQELAESGDKLKAKEEKEKVLWKAAFEKTDGLKVKDNADILKKTIKKRKVEKKKSKVEWGQRKQKVQEKQDAKSKKREDNLNKRKTDNVKNKKKKAIKLGRLLKTN